MPATGFALRALRRSSALRCIPRKTASAQPRDRQSARRSWIAVFRPLAIICARDAHPLRQSPISAAGLRLWPSARPSSPDSACHRANGRNRDNAFGVGCLHGEDIFLEGVSGGFSCAFLECAWWAAVGRKTDSNAHREQGKVLTRSRICQTASSLPMELKSAWGTRSPSGFCASFIEPGTICPSASCATTPSRTATRSSSSGN